MFTLKNYMVDCVRLVFLLMIRVGKNRGNFIGNAFQNVSKPEKIAEHASHKNDENALDTAKQFLRSFDVLSDVLMIQKRRINTSEIYTFLSVLSRQLFSVRNRELHLDVTVINIMSPRKMKCSTKNLLIEAI